MPTLRRLADPGSTPPPPAALGPAPPPLFLGVLATLISLLVLSWAASGTVFQQRRVPSMDSVAYQEEAFDVLFAAWTRGYVGGWAESFEARFAAQNAMHRIFMAAAAPLIPLSRMAMYVYLFSAHALALLCLGVFLYRRTRSPPLALLGPAAYVTGWPFGTLDITPIVDQSLDLASAAFLVLTFLAAWRWMERPTFARAVLTGLSFGAATLHRSICGPQLALMMVAFLAYGLFDARIHRGRVVAQGLVALAVAVALAAPWYWPYRESILHYYGVYSYAVGKPMDTTTALSINLHHVWRVWWEGAWLVAALLALLAALTRTVRWRGVVLVLVAFASPLTPLVASHSEVIEPVYPTLGALGLVPLFVGDARRLWRGAPHVWMAPIALLLATLWTAGSRAEHLTRDVDSLSPDLRLAAIHLTEQIVAEVHERPIVIAGFVTQSHSAIGLASILRIEHKVWARNGPQASLEGDFFIPIGQGCDGGRCWEEVPDATRRAGIQCAIEQMIATSNSIVVVDPERVHDFRYDFVFFSHVHQAEIARMLAADGRLEDRNVVQVVGGVPTRVYIVPEEAEPNLAACCSELLSPNSWCPR